MTATQEFFENQDLQNFVVQFLPTGDILQNYQKVSKSTHAATMHDSLWAILLQRDFKLSSNQLDLKNEQANYLFYKAYYLETHFKFYGTTASHLSLFQKAMHALMPCLKDDSDWQKYFDLSLKLHESAAQGLFSSKNTKQEIENSFIQLLKTTNTFVFERLCWLFVNCYWFFEHHYEAMQFKVGKRFVELYKQTNNETYFVRAKMLNALYWIKKQGGEQFCETASDDESNFTANDLYCAIYRALENKDEVFFPIVARLLLTTIFDSWTFWMRFSYKMVIKQLYTDFTEELIISLSFEDFLVDLYSKLVQHYESFKAIILPHLHEKIMKGNLNVSYILDYKAARKRLLEVMESRPKLFSYIILSKVQTAIQNDSAITGEEALNQKEALKTLVDNIEDYHSEEKNRSFIRSMGQDDSYGMSGLLHSLKKNTPSYRSDEDSDDNNYYDDSFFYKFAAKLQQREYEREGLQQRQMLESLANLLSGTRIASMPNFDENKAIEHINKILGTTFIKNYIATQRGQWQIEKINNTYAIKLTGLQIAQKNDCEWYKAKLIKGGIQAEDIHFDVIKGIKGAGDKYRLRITNIQNITFEQNISSQPAKGFKY